MLPITPYREWEDHQICADLVKGAHFTAVYSAMIHTVLKYLYVNYLI